MKQCKRSGLNSVMFTLLYFYILVISPNKGLFLV